MHIDLPTGTVVSASKIKRGVAKQMTERKTNVLNELEVAQDEEWVVAGIESPVIEELEKAKTFLAVGTCWGGRCKI